MELRITNYTVSLLQKQLWEIIENDTLKLINFKFAFLFFYTLHFLFI